MIRNFVVASLVVTFLYTSVSLADCDDPRPSVPGPGEGVSLFAPAKKKDAKEFFEARAANTTCRDALKGLRTTFVDARKKLLELKTKGAAAAELDKAEKALDTSRDALIPKMEECGECASKPTEHRCSKGGGGREHWYVSEGACLVDPAGFKAASESLKDVTRYARKNVGFPSMMEFIPIDSGNGKQLADRKLEKFPAEAYIVLRGIKFLGSMLGYAQYFKLDWETPKDAVYTTYVSVEAPEGFKEPEVSETTAGGTKKLTTIVGMDKMGAIGSSWYLRNDGYVRYYVQGDFRAEVDFLEAEGRKMMMGTLLEMAARFQ